MTAEDRFKVDVYAHLSDIHHLIEEACPFASMAPSFLDDVDSRLDDLETLTAQLRTLCNERQTALEQDDA